MGISFTSCNHYITTVSESQVSVVIFEMSITLAIVKNAGLFELC